jgi:glycosyltransferase involved in cell wall biosynthesis
MDTITAAVITLNEEANLAACLESVAFADEIVVLDAGSTDGTLEIARRFTDRVYSEPWAGYSRQKNRAFDLATGDWILSLDADERITPDLGAEIVVLLEDPPPAVDGYRLPFKVYYRGKWIRHGGFYPEVHLRLFRRGRGRFGERAVHEAIEVDGPVGLLEHPVEHHTYQSVSDYIRRMERYSTLSAEEYFSKGRRTGSLGVVGRAAFTFFRMYVLERGFLDGYEGLLLAGLYGMYTFVKYAKLRELIRE